MITLSRSSPLQSNRRPTQRDSHAQWRRLQRKLVHAESLRWLFIELLIFGLLVALSIWPMIHAVEALRFI